MRDAACNCGKGASEGLATVLEAVLRETSIAVSVIDREHRTVWSNHATEALLGAPATEVAKAIEDPAEGAEWRFFDANGDRYDFMADLDRCIDSQQALAPSVVGVRRPDGSLFWADTEVIPVDACGCGTRWYAAALSTDLTERRFAEQVLHRLAFSDPLTGLANRVVLEDRLGGALRRNQSRSLTSTLFYFDLDRFKEVNDSFGHEAGDGVLREVANRLAATFRPGDTVARLGGDEFAVLAEGLADGSDLIERVRTAVATPISIGVDGLRQDLVIGISGGRTAVDGGDSVRKVLHLADRAMYADKSRRGGDVQQAQSPGPPPVRR